MCKVSVIVPLYNGKKTIKKCLTSLLRQTIHNIEILVVNDGSQDNGVDVVLSFMKKDRRIRLISQENAGQGAARNRGIAEAKGEFLGFVDCDDFVDENMYQIMALALDKSGADIAVCQEKNVYIDGEQMQLLGETHFPYKKNTVCSKDRILDWFFNFSYLSLNSMCYKLIRRSVFEKYSIKVPENFRYAEDLVACAALFSVVDKVAVIPKSLYYYVHEKNSSTYNYSFQHAVDIYTDWKEVKAYMDVSGYTGSMDNFSLGMRFSSLKQLYWSKNKKDKRSAGAEKLKNVWERERKKYLWKPNIKGVYIPFAHKVKIYVSYFRMERFVCFLLKKLSWIPFFNFMA